VSYCSPSALPLAHARPPPAPRLGAETSVSAGPSSLTPRAASGAQLMALAYDNGGHIVNGVEVPTQGFNVFASVTNSGAYVRASAAAATPAAGAALR